MLWLVMILVIFIFEGGRILLLELGNGGKAVGWLFILFWVGVMGLVVYYLVGED